MAQEQGERSRLLSQMREMLAGPSHHRPRATPAPAAQSGLAGGAGAGAGTQGAGREAEAGEAEVVGAERLRERALKAVQECAKAQAGRERAEAALATWKGEAKALRERLAAAEQVSWASKTPPFLLPTLLHNAAPSFMFQSRHGRIDC